MLGNKNIFLKKNYVSSCFCEILIRFYCVFFTLGYSDISSEILFQQTSSFYHKSQITKGTNTFFLFSQKDLVFLCRSFTLDVYLFRFRYIPKSRVILRLLNDTFTASSFLSRNIFPRISFCSSSSSLLFSFSFSVSLPKICLTFFTF